MNQIDNHFSKKLRDLEIKPSDRANELFKSKIAPPSEDKKAIWKYFALAASVMLALGVLFALNLNPDVLPGTAVVLPQELEPATETISEAETTIQEEQAEESVIEEFIKQNEQKPVLASVEIPKTKEVILVNKKPENEIATTETKRINLGNVAKINPEKVYTYQSNDLVDYTLIDVIAGRLEVETETSFAEPAQEIKVKEKPLIAKVINEVKYLLHGEKLDLERAGIKPAATALAHNPTGLIASETQQFRENVHRIKEIFR
jgi:hypothetical protein